MTSRSAGATSRPVVDKDDRARRPEGEKFVSPRTERSATRLLPVPTYYVWFQRRRAGVERYRAKFTSGAWRGQCSVGSPAGRGKRREGVAVKETTRRGIIQRKGRKGGFGWLTWLLKIFHRFQVASRLSLSTSAAYYAGLRDGIFGTRRVLGGSPLS